MKIVRCPKKALKFESFTHFLNKFLYLEHLYEELIMDYGLWLLSEEDFSWNCYTGILSFDGRYNSCKTGYQSLSSTDTLPWKKFSLT